MYRQDYDHSYYQNTSIQRIVSLSVMEGRMWREGRLGGRRVRREGGRDRAVSGSTMLSTNNRSQSKYHGLLRPTLTTAINARHLAHT